ncbi:MAG TPA: aminoglycoside phosphotransferase family protein [Gemmatimonadales bacterium]|nr:aminoglycoside phosphotransferase family protein [Gemmatimonadales bacterium]
MIATVAGRTLSTRRQTRRSHRLPFTVPAPLAENCRKTPERAAWLERLPDTVRELERCWSIVAGPPFDSVEMSCAWVAPAAQAGGRSVVLKLAMPHMEGMHEIDGLRFWDGDPTVRLIEADASRSAMLIERCAPGTHLRVLPESEQDVIIAGLLRRLWRSPRGPQPFRPLADLMAYWTEETERAIERWRDPGLVRTGLGLLRELPRNAAASVLLATDLHAGNILRAEREPWLVIDPKPFLGDPAYDATQHLFNCPERVCSNPDGTIARFADRLGVDPERVRLWLFARAAAEPRDDWERDPWRAIARAVAP